MDYYKPTILFRQNAIKKVRSAPDFYNSRKFSNESWLFDDNHTNDIIDKTCSNNKLKIASNYWKIPDDELYLTSIAINKENPEQLAISSGTKDSNLYIYDINQESMILTHQQTISLPYIQSMRWLNYDEEESTLLTGHKNGTVHMVSIPNSQSGEECAKILKRFNHKKHFSNDKIVKNPSIRQIIERDGNDSILTLCNENIFLWDLKHRSDLPILKNQHLGILQFDSSHINNGILGLAGEFGIALNDLRAPINTPSIFTPNININDNNSNERKIPTANCIKWAPYDSNVLAASHIDGVIRLWDIRAQGYFGQLHGHNDLITSLEWSEESSSDLYSGSNDGNIIHWDLNFEQDLNNCCLNEGLDSIDYHKNSFLVDDEDIYQLVNKRQCGTLIPASKTPIVQLTSTSDKLLSIDGSSFLGVHAKRGLDSLVVEEGTSDKIMDEMLNELPQMEAEEIDEYDDDEESLFDHSSNVLIESPTSALTMSPTHKKQQQSITNLENDSQNTLIGENASQLTILKRRLSSSTIKVRENVLIKAINDDFTYEKIQPLSMKRSDFDPTNQSMVYI